MKKIKIKVCGLTELNDVEFCVKKNIDFLGLNFYPESKRYINPDKAKKIIKRIKQNYTDLNSKFVGVFVKSNIDEICELYNFLNLDFVQLHSDEAVDFCKELKSYEIKIIKVFRIYEDINFKELDKFNDFTDYFLFDKKEKNIYGGTGKTINWKIFKGIKLNKNFFIAGGIGLNNFIDAVTVSNAFAVDINSKVELRPGKKDLNKINKILTTLNSHYSKNN